eukprot:363767-Chlamydomonas_euryale.AAC.9
MPGRGTLGQYALKKYDATKGKHKGARGRDGDTTPAAQSKQGGRRATAPAAQSKRGGRRASAPAAQSKQGGPAHPQHRASRVGGGPAHPQSKQLQFIPRLKSTFPCNHPLWASVKPSAISQHSHPPPPQLLAPLHTSTPPHLTVVYEDGDSGWLNFSKERAKLATSPGKPPPPGRSAKPKAASGASKSKAAPASAAAAAAPRRRVVMSDDDEEGGGGDDEEEPEDSGSEYQAGVCPGRFVGWLSARAASG